MHTEGWTSQIGSIPSATPKTSLASFLSAVAIPSCWVDLHVGGLDVEIHEVDLSEGMLAKIGEGLGKNGSRMQIRYIWKQLDMHDMKEDREDR